MGFLEEDYHGHADSQVVWGLALLQSALPEVTFLLRRTEQGQLCEQTLHTFISSVSLTSLILSLNKLPPGFT